MSDKELIQYKKNNVKLQRELDLMRKYVSIFRHEIRGDLGNLGSIADILEEDVADENKIWINSIKKIGSRGLTLLEMTNLALANDKELKEQIEGFYTEDLRDEVIVPYLQTMKEHRIGTKLGYDNSTLTTVKPLAVLGLSTAFGNCLNMTKSEIKVGMKDKKDKLEVLFENETNIKSRNVYGLKQGMGEEILKMVAHRLGGNYEKYDSPKIDLNQYQEQAHFGSRDIIPINSGSKIYGLKFEFPKVL